MEPAALPAASPRERALAGFARLLTEAPWTVEPADIARLRAAGLSAEGLEQAITVAALFNYFTRVADGTGIEFDYASPLPRIAVDRARAPLPRPPRSAWNPRVDGGALPALAHRPQTAAAFAPWRAHLFERDAPLSRADRAVLARAVALALCDPGALARWDDAGTPRDARGESLAAYATQLTLAPWRVVAEDLRPLRAHGLDDAALLTAIALIAHQNAVTRMHHALAATHAA